jgi:hypothetical protein
MRGMVTLVSGSGTLNVSNRARVVVAAGSDALPVANIIGLTGHYATISSQDYPVIGFVAGTTDSFYVGRYDGLNLGGITHIVKRYLIKEQIGYMSHSGMNIQIAGVDYESSLGIQDGANAGTLYPTPTDAVYPDQTSPSFMGNFLIQIDGGDYYWMTSINGSDGGNTTISMDGNGQYWRLLPNGGTAVNIKIYKFVQKGATIMRQEKDLPDHTFRKIDRSGSPNLTGDDQSSQVMSLSASGDDGHHDFINQKETLSYKIEYTNGSKEEGEI